LEQSKWVVYATPPFGGSTHVLIYLALRSTIPGSFQSPIEVAFGYKDHHRGTWCRITRLDPHDFIRRFLEPVLPDGFHRVRRYGFLTRGD